jgi:hypothetical protein
MQKSAEGIVGEGNEPDKEGKPHITEGLNGSRQVGDGDLWR